MPPCLLLDLIHPSTRQLGCLTVYRTRAVSGRSDGSAGAALGDGIALATCFKRWKQDRFKQRGAWLPSVVYNSPRRVWSSLQAAAIMSVRAAERSVVPVLIVERPSILECSWSGLTSLNGWVDVSSNVRMQSVWLLSLPTVVASASPSGVFGCSVCLRRSVASLLSPINCVSLEIRLRWAWCLWAVWLDFGVASASGGCMVSDLEL